MRRSGTANLPLHGGKCPRWLFGRMVRLSGAIAEVVVHEYSQAEFLKRMSDPYWFQAFSCAIGFDWHSSGVSTTLMGALKTAIDPQELGLAVCGGKGRASRKTPEEVKASGELFSLPDRKTEHLAESSRMAAKVDNAAVQDGYRLYHHCLMMTERGDWAVVQQGMSDSAGYARRYHWLGEGIESFVEEPHSAVCCDSTGRSLNMTAVGSEASRKACVDLSQESPGWVMRQVRKGPQRKLTEFSGLAHLKMPERHPVVVGEDVNPERIEQILLRTYEEKLGDFEQLLGMKGVGPATVRSLALLSELIYGEEPSFKDPCRYSFCVGGKDGFPYSPRLHHYDEVAETMAEAIGQAKLGRRDKLEAVKRVNSLSG